MADITHARAIVQTAERGLRDLMGTALAEHRYRDLADVAPMADALAALIAQSAADSAARAEGRPLTNLRSSPLEVPGVSTIPIPQRGRASACSREDEYPRFVRDGDKLVKIGWSKKDRREYEHRAPRSAVVRVAETLAARVRPGEVFRMDAILPFADGAGKDIPSYQAYLALAWFRKLGIVEEKGKDGYAIGRDLLDQSAVLGWFDALGAA